MKRRNLAMLGGAVAVAAAIAGAPLAAAEPNQSQESCETAGQSSTVCESPGNVEIKDAPPSVTFYPYGSPPPTAG
jgi:hypothetical protein